MRGESVVSRIRAEVLPFRTMSVVVAVPAVVWAVWASGPSWTTPALVVLAVAGAALGVIDTRTHRLPDAIVFPTTAIVGGLLVLAALGSALAGEPAWDALGRAVLGFAAHAGFYGLMWWIAATGVGLGDVKLAGILGAVGAWWGWDAFLVTMVAPYVLGGLVSLPLLLFRVVGRKSHIPFGPFMLLGVVAALTWERLVA